MAGDSFIEGLLVSGWFSKLVRTCGHVEESIARWTSNLSEFIQFSHVCFYLFVTSMLCFFECTYVSFCSVVFAERGSKNISM